MSNRASPYFGHLCRHASGQLQDGVAAMPVMLPPTCTGASSFSFNNNNDFVVYDVIGCAVNSRFELFSVLVASIENCCVKVRQPLSGKVPAAVSLTIWTRQHLQEQNRSRSTPLRQVLTSSRLCVMTMTMTCDYMQLFR